MRRTLFIFFWIALASCSPHKEGQSDFVASQIELTDLDGNEIDLNNLNGKLVLVNFWATWCRPCIQEMPGFATLQNQLVDKNIVFYFASNEDATKIIKFKEERAFDLNFVRVKNLESLGVEALPTTFIFDSHGDLKFSEVGYRKWDDGATIEMITKLMNE